MMELFISSFVTFFVVIDPPGCAPIFASLTQGTAAAHRRAMAIRSVLIASAILLFFAVAGRGSAPRARRIAQRFKIAGGIMLFLIALEMVFEKRRSAARPAPRTSNSDGEAEDISVFPMGIPMIAGPRIDRVHHA
jgi:multiple antibiotic resistance protein